MTNTLKTTALLAALTALLVVIGGALGGQGGMLLFFGIAVIMNLGAYWFSGDIALKMAGAREVTPESFTSSSRSWRPTRACPGRALRSSTARRRTRSPPAATRTTPSSR
jgi:Zn-dependent protease with chaperone function